MCKFENKSKVLRFKGLRFKSGHGAAGAAHALAVSQADKDG